MAKPVQGCCLLLLFLPLLLLAENPRKHIMRDPISPGLGTRGLLLKAGPVYAHTRRTGVRYLDENEPVTGRTTRLYGALLGAAYDFSGPRGEFHFLPGLSFLTYPNQDAYTEDDFDIVYTCNHFHLCASFPVGYSQSYRVYLPRAYVSAGPTLNVLFWQRMIVKQRVVWGAVVNAGRVWPYNEKIKLLAEVSYKFHFYNRYYFAYDLDMNAYVNSVSLSFGVAL